MTDRSKSESINQYRTIWAGPGDVESREQRANRADSAQTLHWIEDQLRDLRQSLDHLTSLVEERRR